MNKYPFSKIPPLSEMQESLLDACSNIMDVSSLEILAYGSDWMY